jgi:hypothetical protein
MSFSIIDEPLPLRDFSQQNISEYIIKLNQFNENHGQDANLKSSIAGFKMFKNKFMNDVKFSMITKDGTIEIFSTVRVDTFNSVLILILTIR